MRLLFFPLLFLCQFSFAQRPPEVGYPKGYFRNPLNIPILLSGNFGELRPNHYHMGLDLKTQARENLPVYAAAEGYIARIKIEPGGFGRALYINHPNGFTTLYAHLNDFNPKLEAWVKEQQYRLESWSLGLELTPDLFPVKKGDFLANSGNTGGSQAPHLHFEIRRTENDVNVNPMSFGFPISDNTRPSILRLGIYDRKKSVYEQSPRIIPVKNSGAGKYITTVGTVTVSSPKVSLAFTGYDTQSGSSNLNGIYEAILYMDGKPIVDFRMDNISYNDTRYMNAHIDYRLKTGGGAYLQHLSELPGYINSIYRQYDGDGILDLSDGAAHEILIEVKDAHNNKSELRTRIQYKGGANTTVSQPAGTGKLFSPLMLDGFESEQCEFFIGEKCLYDEVFVKYSTTPGTGESTVSDLHHIGSSLIPLQEPFLVRIRPNRALSELEQSRTVMQWTSGARTNVVKVEWKDGWASANFRDFGTYKLVVDNEPPVVVPVGFNDGANLSKASGIVFTVRDNSGRFKNVRPELNGKWLRFTNDKGRIFRYSFDENCPRGSHELVIRAEDEAGNQTIRSFKFTR